MLFISASNFELRLLHRHGNHASRSFKLWRTKMTNVTQNTNVAPSLTSVIDEMITNRIKWQNGTYAASNAELYAILGNCLELFNKAKDAKTGLAKAIT